jgi:hypothetical protein
VTRAQLDATVAVTGLLAAVGALASAYDVDRGFDQLLWVVRACAACAVVVFVLSNDSAAGCDTIARRPRLTSALLVALLFPYGVESVAQSIGSDLAIIATVVSVALMRRGGAVRFIAGGLVAGLACASEASAIVWPLGYAYSVVSCGDTRRMRGVLLICGAVGVAIGWGTGGVFAPSDPVFGGLAAVHRDLMILMPLILLGMVGLAKARSEVLETRADYSMQISWTAVALACLCLVVIGVPLDVRLCALPLFWWIPTAVSELGAITIGSQRADSSLRMVGFLSVAMTACLMIPGVLRLLDGPLIAVYLLG